MGKTQKTIQKINKSKFNFKILPIMVIVGILPLIVYAHFYEVAVYGTYSWYHPDEYPLDGYTYTKVAVFSVITVIMLIETVTSFIISAKEQKKAFIKKMWPLFVYLIFVLLSTAFAMDKYLAIHGGYDQMEPVLVLVGYAVLPMYIYLVVKDENDIRYIGYAGLFSAFGVSIIGILQMVGYDIYMQDWIRPFIFSKEINEMVGEVSSKYMVYSSLGNSNYIGTFVCEMLPLVLMMLVIKNSWWVKAIAIVDTFCLLIVLYGSKSETGMFIFVGMVVLAFIFLVGRYLKKWYITFPLLFILVFSVYTFNKTTDGRYADKVVKKLGLEETNFDLKGIITTGDCIEILYKDQDLKLTVEYNEPKIKVIIRDQNSVLFYEEDYYFNWMYIKINDEDKIRLKANRRFETDFEIRMVVSGKEVGFIYHTDSNEYKILNADNVEDESVIWDNVFPRRSSFASHRGFIWGVSIPRLKETILVGVGPDNFPVKISENWTDYALKYNTGEFKYVFTRPHNYYIQTGINVGCISLLACLAFFVLYLADCGRLFFGKKMIDDKKKSGLLLMLAVVGFLGCGIANDSMITVSPIFWTILGMGIAINEWSKRDINSKDDIKIK